MNPNAGLPIDLLAKSAEPGAGIDFGTTPEVRLEGKVAEERAAQYSVAQSGHEEELSYPDLIASFTQGSQKALQESLKAKVELDQRKVRYSQIEDMVKSGQPLSVEQENLLLNLPEDKFRNPDSIVQEEFSKRANQFVVAASDSPLDTEEMNTLLDHTDAYNAKQLFIRNMQEDAQARYKNIAGTDYSRRCTIC